MDVRNHINAMNDATGQLLRAQQAVATATRDAIHAASPHQVGAVITGNTERSNQVCLFRVDTIEASVNAGGTGLVFRLEGKRINKGGEAGHVAARVYLHVDA